MTRVLFDDEIFSTQFHGGVSRYFAEIIGGLAGEVDIQAILPFAYSCNAHLLASPAFKGGPLLGGMRFPGSRRLLRAINRRATRAALARTRYDLVHATWYDSSLLDRVPVARLVVTIHDMIPEILPVQAIQAGHGDKLTLAAHAGRLIAVSETTAADLARITGRSRAAIRVIHHGVNERMRWHPGMGRPAGMPDDFILFVGKRGGYKNFAGVATALAAVLAATPGLRLVCLGGGPMTAGELAPFAGDAHRVVQAEAGDVLLAWCYAHAGALVFPSLYEGFGLPILEAFINRCPALLAERSCFPEIAADAALYFDPDAPDRLVELIGRVRRDRGLAERLGDAGIARAADFTWRRAAAATAAVYREMAA